MTTRLAMLGVAFYLGVAVTDAEAAKGVKKTNLGTGHHVASGVVMSITPDKSGFGTFTMKTSTRLKKALAADGAAVTTTKSNSLNLQLHVSSTTQFMNSVGSVSNNANAMSLHKGQRVLVKFTGQQAEQVRIYTPQHATGNFMRHRSPVYHAHISHHRHR